MADPSFGSGLTDFSVDAQRRLFVEQQERERKAAENRKASRTAKRLSAAAAAQAGENGGGAAVALSGLVSRMEAEAKDGGPRRVRVGDDDDDSIADDDWSLDSEESFYVGIERADYAQPDALAMYGEDVGDDVAAREDRFGIGRVGAALLSVEGGKGAASSDWDADVVPVHDEKSGSSLHAFMNGSNGGTTKASRSMSHDLVARPVVGRGLGWTAEGTLPAGDDDAADDQVYEHAAAEGKAFIDKIANGPPGASDALDASEKRGRGQLPVLSPLAVFAPGLSSSSGAGGGGEDNAARQMRERELRREEQMAAERRVADFERMVASRKDAGGKVDADEVVGLLEGLMKGRKQKAWC